MQQPTHHASTPVVHAGAHSIDRMDRSDASEFDPMAVPTAATGAAMIFDTHTLDESVGEALQSGLVDATADTEADRHVLRRLAAMGLATVALAAGSTDDSSFEGELQGPLCRDHVLHDENEAAFFSGYCEYVVRTMLGAGVREELVVAAAVRQRLDSAAQLYASRA